MTPPMEPKKLSTNVSEITDNIKEYVQLRLKILSLSLTEMLSRLIGFAIILLIFFFTFMFMSLFGSVAFILWFRDNAGPAYVGAMIVALFYLFIGVLILLLRNTLIINPLVSQISKVLKEDENDDER
jgi:hypothetical protein